MHDALKRRCLYHWVDYPDFERELAILRARAPEATAALEPRGGGLRAAAARARTCSRSPASPRPSTGRSAWSRSTRSQLSPQVIADTLGALLKYQDDIARLQGSEAKRILDEARAALGPV